MRSLAFFVGEMKIILTKVRARSANVSDSLGVLSLALTETDRVIIIETIIADFIMKGYI
tara:strand:+ start:681 stop:857 length:177 start_codon:yes stop_codon:yes gene_type:complete